MDPHPQPHSGAPAPADAATRLELVADVRRRARRAATAPSLAMLALGLLLAARGVALERWPHAVTLTVASLAALVIARLVLRRGVRPGGRARWAGVAFAVTAVAFASAAGASPVIAGVAATTAAAAFLADLRVVAASAVLVGGLSELLVLRGAPTWATLTVFGLGLAALGVAAWAAERAGP